MMAGRFVSKLGIQKSLSFSTRRKEGKPSILFVIESGRGEKGAKKTTIAQSPLFTCSDVSDPPSEVLYLVCGIFCFLAWCWGGEQEEVFFSLFSSIFR